MKKFLCYDTNDAASGKINVDSRGMLKANSTVPSGSTPYQQLVTDGDGNAKWEFMTLPVVFWTTGETSSATISCNQEYEQLRQHLEKYNFLIMSGQLYIKSSKTSFTMVECIQKTNWLEFLFVVPQDAGDGLAIGTILTVYYLENGTITFTRPLV